MPNLKKIFVSGLVAFIPQLSWAAVGPSSSGGGNIQRSTPAEVKKAIPGDYTDLLMEIINELKVDAPIKIQDPVILPILKKVVAMPLVDEIMHSGSPKDFKIHLNEHGPCLDPHAPKRLTDASVVGDNTHADVCMSVPRLTRYAPLGLKKEIGALIIHELVHAAGYGETEAVAVQQYVLREFYQPCWYEFAYLDASGQKGTHIEVILRDLNREMTKVFPIGLANGPEVDIEREFQFQDRWGYSTQTYGNRAEEAKFVLTGTDKGSATFLAMSADGNVLHVSANWGLLKGYNRELYEAKDLPDLKVSIDGKPLDMQSLWISGACFHDDL